MSVVVNKNGFYGFKGSYYVKDKNGKSKRIGYYQHSGSNGFKTKKEAKKAEIEFIEERKRLASRKQLTMQETLEKYEEYNRRNMKESSIYSSIKSLRKFKHLYNMNVREIKAPMIQDVLDDLNNKEYSLNYIDKVYYQFKKYWNYLLREELVDDQIMNKVHKIIRINDVENPNEKIAYWTEQDFKNFICNVSDNQLYYTLFTLLFYTGLRKGEALALTFNDIDLNRNTINVYKTLSSVSKVNDPLITPPKNKTSKRKINITNNVQKVLFSWKQKCMNMYGYEENWFVFMENGHVLSTSTLGRVWTKYCTLGKGYTKEKFLKGKLLVGEKVFVDGSIYHNVQGLGGAKHFSGEVIIKSVEHRKNEINYELDMIFPKIRIHDLRHSCVSMMINHMGKQEYLPIMAKHFGHSINEMIRTYSHIFSDKEEELIKNYETFLMD